MEARKRNTRLLKVIASLKLSAHNAMKEAANHCGKHQKRGGE